MSRHLASGFLRHDPASLDCVDIEPALFPFIDRHFPNDWLRDRRVRLVAEDGRTFTFHLREGVYFHESPIFDGPRELVAEDVRWSLERLLHPETGSPGVSFFARLRGFEDYRAGRAPHVAGIEVRGRYEVAFTLD